MKILIFLTLLSSFAFAEPPERLGFYCAGTCLWGNNAPNTNFATGYFSSLSNDDSIEHVTQALAQTAKDSPMCQWGNKIIGCQAIYDRAPQVRCVSACGNLDGNLDTMETGFGRNELEAFINSIHEVNRYYNCSIGVRKVFCD